MTLNGGSFVGSPPSGPLYCGPPAATAIPAMAIETAMATQIVLRLPTRERNLSGGTGAPFPTGRKSRQPGMGTRQAVVITPSLRPRQPAGNSSPTQLALRFA